MLKKIKIGNLVTLLGQTYFGYDEVKIKFIFRSDMNKRWTDIGLELFRLTDGKSFRKPKSIRERWLSHLNP